MVHIRRFRSKSRGALIVLLCLATGFSAVACGDDTSTPPPPPDITPPDVEVVFPTSQEEYDADGDGLADIHIRFLSEDVDPTTAVLTRLGGVNGPAPADANLLEFWTVEQWDAQGILVHETIENLLYQETSLLTFSVADTAGNVTEISVELSLPFGAFHLTIVTGVPFIPSPPVGLVFDVDICEDGHLYATANKTMVVIDTEELTVLGTFPNPNLPEELRSVLCVPNDPYAYLTGPRVQRFDRQSMTWAAQVEGSFGSSGIIQSRADPDLLYVGESGSVGHIGVISRSEGRRVRQLDLPFDPDMETVSNLAVLPGDQKLYLTRFFEGGVTVVDPIAEVVLDTLDFHPTNPSLGLVDELLLSHDATRLYAAAFGAPPGVWEIDSVTDEFTRVLDLSVYRPINISLSPDGRRIFVNTADRLETGQESSLVLMSVNEWQILEYFPRPRPLGEERWDLSSVFRPDGKLIFSAHNSDVDVYINRGRQQ